MGDSHGGRMKLRQLMNHEQYRRNRVRVYDLYAFGTNEACFARHQDKLPCFFTPDVYWRTWRADRIYERIAARFPVCIESWIFVLVCERKGNFVCSWNEIETSFIFFLHKIIVYTYKTNIKIVLKYLSCREREENQLEKIKNSHY